MKIAACRKDNNMTETTKKKKAVAVIGGGVSGLAAAWHLTANASDTHTVQLFEADDRLGGHAYTCKVPVSDGDAASKKDSVDVDIGFMVFNNDNYPNMTKWFDALEVQQENSNMSLSVSLDHGKTVEWNSEGLGGLLAKPTQALSPNFHRFVKDMLRFNTEAVELLRLSHDDPRRGVTIGQYLRNHRYSESFCSYYLFPMVAALWSMSIEDVLDFPAESLINFCCNHKMLQLFDRPQVCITTLCFARRLLVSHYFLGNCFQRFTLTQTIIAFPRILQWKTVSGRSQSYTLKMKEFLGDKANVSTPVTSAKHNYDGTYELFTTGNKSLGVFDELIFACHAPTAAEILKNCGGSASKQATDLLVHISYSENAVYLHSDPNLMPKRRRAWASWNCIGDSKLLSINTNLDSSKEGEAMEGGDSGFGNKIHATNGHANDTNGVSNGDSNSEGLTLEGKDGRMKAVYVTYWLNQLQNLETDTNIFVSLNPHEMPDPELTHKRVILAHPQFNANSLKARRELLDNHQGKEGLWFCGAWAGHGFHEDGCRSGFDVATKLTSTALPWCANYEDKSIMVAPAPDLSKRAPSSGITGAISRLHRSFTYDLPVWICQKLVYSFLRKAILKGRLALKLNDGTVESFGDGTECDYEKHPITLRIFDPWFFVKVALQYDLGVARSYMAGQFVVEPLSDAKEYNPTIRSPSDRDETTIALGDPLGLVRFFLLIIRNRDNGNSQHEPRKAIKGRSYSSVVSNASGLLIAKIGSFLNYLRYKIVMDNSERGGSLKNIHAHYDLSNDLFTAFLDKETLMYSSAIYDAVKAPAGRPGVVFRGSLEEAQWRKLDTLCDRAQIQPGQTVLDIGFGWGGLSLHAARKYGCKVTGITLSVEQKALAEERVKKEGLGHLITFEVVDYRAFARRKENLGRFDRVLCCEMIEAVGHEHLPEYFWAVEQVLNRDGILVMEAITTPEERYETYRRTTDLINTIIFPGSLCPSLHALVDAAYQSSSLTLEHIDNIGLHYAKTLSEWRQRFNAKEKEMKELGFDEVFLRVWNYYLTYCEAGFMTQTINCVIIVFARAGCKALAPLSESRSLTQAAALSDKEIEEWMKDGH